MMRLTLWLGFLSFLLAGSSDAQVGLLWPGPGTPASSSSPLANCLLLTGTTTNCLLLTGTTTNALIL